MPTLNFSVFVDKVESGGKRQTIRPVGRRIYRPGDTIYLYTDMRKKACRKLGESICTKVDEILFIFWQKRLGHLDIYTGNMGFLPFSKRDAIAKADGFNSYLEFAEFFVKLYKLQSGDSKKMQIIKWGDLLK